jgi:diguanylate cyclase (GGDEF)-like protein
MLSEIQLQTRLTATLFLLSAITMIVLGVQNFRYGLYELVYAATFLSVIYLSTSLYAQFAPEAKYLKEVCLLAGITTLLCIFANANEYPEELKHWLFPIGLLCYLNLPFNQATIFNAVMGICYSLILFFSSSLSSALELATSFALFMGLTSTYAQLHQKRSRTLVELEIHDPLTKAYNYRHLKDTLKKEMCRADRTGRPISLITLEIDYFPQVQDMHGQHHTNDLISRFAETLKAMIRAGDSDYFDGKQTSFLLLPCTPSEGVLVIAERIRRTIEESSWPVVDSITVSLGCTTYIPDDCSADRDGEARKLIENAQIGLVEAQKNGHNRVCLHSH